MNAAVADTDLTQRPVQFRGSALARCAMALAGWTVLFDGLPTKQGVIVVYPHTSNWDFIVGILAKWAIGIEVKFWAKDSLFTWPLFGRWLRGIGGVPVDRSSPQGAVGEMVRLLVRARRDGRLFWLALAPEGTRKRAAGWRSGFYVAALEAQVPLAIASIDFGTKVVALQRFMMLSGDAVRDLQTIESLLKNVRGRRPGEASPIRLA